MGIEQTIDITTEQRAIVLALLERYLPGTTAWVYGSRAKWIARAQSDLDLVVFATSEQNSQVGALREAFEESNLPFRVDLFVWDTVPESFREQIEADHVVLVEKEHGRHFEQSTQCLGDVADIVMGQSPPGDTVSECHGLALLNGPTEFGAHHPIPVQFTTDARKCAQKGDLLFCVRGSTTGRMNWADQRYAIGRGVAAIRHRHETALQPFIRAVIEFELPNLLTQATGSTFPNVSAHQLAAIPYPGLDKGEQRAIAHILGTLDDKIELNRRMNETLEAMARALFKSWFVDFDPVRAKAALRNHAALEGKPANQRGSDWSVERARAYLDKMDPEIAALFPDRLVDSALGEIPAGWEVFRLDELADHHTKSIAPSSFPKTEFEHFSIPAYDSGQTPAIDRGTAIKSNKIVVPSDTVLLSKLNPEIPRVWIPDMPNEFLQICSTEFLVFTPRYPANRGLLFLLFTDIAFRTMLQSMVTGTSKSHQRVAPKALKQSNVLSGAPALFDRFGDLVTPMLARTVRNRAESHVHTTLRDTLLPDLISGKLRARAKGLINRWVA